MLNFRFIDQFTEGVRLLIYNWSTLSSAIEQGFDNENIDTYNVIKSYIKQNVDVDNLTDNDLKRLLDKPTTTNQNATDKREMLIESLIDQMLNYDSTSIDLQEYIWSFMLEEVNVICDEGDDESYKEIVEIMLKLYEEAKKGNTKELDKLKILDEKVSIKSIGIIYK